MEQGASSETMLCKRRLAFQCFYNKINHADIAGLGRWGYLHHSRQQSNHHRWLRHKVRRELYRLLRAASCNRCNGIIQKTLLIPARSQFTLRRLSRFVACDIRGTMTEELLEFLSRRLVERDRLQRLRHVRQPGAPLVRSNLKSRMGFPQAQPPAFLRMFFSASEELNEEGGELFRRASEALTWKKMTQYSISADTRIKLRGKPLAASFSSQRLQQCWIFLQAAFCLYQTEYAMILSPLSRNLAHDGGESDLCRLIQCDPLRFPKLFSWKKAAKADGLSTSAIR